MTTDNVSVDRATEQADILDDLMGAADLGSAYRDQSIPEGTLLAEGVDATGSTVRYKKPSSMVRRGNVNLPERFEAWDKFGVRSMLPTAQMNYHLSKQRPDAPGERTFHTHTRGATRASCQTCPPLREPIEFKCPWCVGVRGQRNTFMSENDAILHQRRFHEDEYAAHQQQLDREERRAQIEVQRQIAASQQAVAEAMLQNMNGNPPAQPGKAGK
jgi:hypothetical protein